MCPAVPLAFPSSRVWLANLSSAALGPGVSTSDLYQSKKLLTSGDLRGCEVPSCTYFWCCWKGEAVGTTCVITACALQDDGEGAAFFPFSPGLLLLLVPFGRIWLDLFKQRLS